MKSVGCSECNGRVFMQVYGRLARYGIGSREDHDLCARCYKEQRDRLAAERIGPKPYWAVRSSLKIMQQQDVKAWIEQGGSAKCMG